MATKEREHCEAVAVELTGCSERCTDSLCVDMCSHVAGVVERERADARAKALEEAAAAGFEAINHLVNANTSDTPTGGEIDSWLQDAAVRVDAAIRALVKP